MNNSSNLPETANSDEATTEASRPRLRFTFPSGATPLTGYTIKRGLGIGGFGEVYFAVSDSGKEVALKRIARNLDVELRGVTQCLNLKHANLIGLWDIQVDDHHENWVVMEYVSGPSLRDVLIANPKGLPIDDVIWWFQGIAAGVHYLHQNGIVHRDLKPGNIFHDNEAQLVKIGDYGLSKFISCSQRSGHTESVGTVHYMAPEIGRGIYGREIDVYSLGIVLFELLTGRVPFEGECSQEIIMKHLTAEPDVSALSAPYNQVVRRALVKDPERRYSSVLEMLADLPRDFWPPALRRSVMQLQDTGKHDFPKQASAPTEDQALPGEKAVEVPTVGPSTSAAEQDTSRNTDRASSNDRKAVHDSRFNVPPGTPGGSRHSIRQQAAIFYKESPTSTEAETGSGQTPPANGLQQSARLQQRFSQTGTSMVFGDVHYHEIVDAEVVPAPAPAPTKPVAVPGNRLSVSPPPLPATMPGSFPGGSPPFPQATIPQSSVPAPLSSSYAFGTAPGGPANSVEPLNRRTKRAWWKDQRYIQAARQYTQHLTGVERLTGMLQSFLVSVSLMAVASLVISLVAGSSDFGAIGTDNRFAFGVWFFLVGTFACWLLQVLAMLWNPSSDISGSRVASLLPVSLATAGAAYLIGSMIDVYFEPIAGINPLLLRGYPGQLLNYQGAPQFLGYSLFFFGTFVFSYWWRQTSPIRVHRFSIFPVIRAMLAGALFSALLGVGILVPAALCGAVSIALQLSCDYYNDRQRSEIRAASFSHQ